MKCRSLDEFSWAVGLFEGEGTIFARSRTTKDTRFRHLVAIAMSDKDIIERFARIFPGGGSIMVKRPKEERFKTMYAYEISRSDIVKEFLLTIRPYLSIKKTSECDFCLSVIEEAGALPRKAPTYRRKHKSLTENEITMMRAERVAGALLKDLADKYLISISHVSRLTKH